MPPRDFKRPASQPALRPVSAEQRDREREQTPPVGTDIAVVYEFRVKRLEDDAAAIEKKIDTNRDRFDAAIKEVNASILKLTEQVAGVVGGIETMQGAVTQAMELVTASANGAITIQTLTKTTTIEDTADAKKTRRAFSLKVLAILGTIATAITTAIAAGRC